jgi:hypothetical protein
MRPTMEVSKSINQAISSVVTAVAPEGLPLPDAYQSRRYLWVNRSIQRPTCNCYWGLSFPH